MGVQQSLKSRLNLCLKNIIDNTKPEDVPSCFALNETQIGRDTGWSTLHLPRLTGNHGIAIFKVLESDYDALYETMQDIITKAKELKEITTVPKHLRCKLQKGSQKTS